MKVYIATGFDNKLQHNELRDYMLTRGHTLTYDWTLGDGKAYLQGIEHARAIGTAELNGVRDADVVVVLLPGGRGTHVELGTALALGKEVVMFNMSPCMLNGVGDHHRGDCLFYYQLAIAYVCWCKIHEFTDCITAVVDEMEKVWACKTQ